MSAVAARSKHEVALAESESQALEALDAIEQVSTPDEAEELLRMITVYQQAVRLARLGKDQEKRWGVVRLRAERKMGELLGPADSQGKRTDLEPVTGNDKSPDGAEREAIRKARKVAAISQEDFDAYLETTDQPTRAGILRAAMEKAKPTSPANPMRQLVSSVAERCQHIANLEPNIDAETIAELPAEERQQWLQSLKAGQKVLRQIARSLAE